MTKKSGTVTFKAGDKSVTMTGEQFDKIAGVGHNGGPALDDETQDVGGVAGKRLKSIIERVERLEEEKAGLAEDIKEVFGEAKGTGFDVKTIRKLLRLRKMDVEKRREEDELLELYKGAIGLQ